MKPLTKSVLAFLTSILLAVAVSGCASSVNRVMESWEGHQISELIASWGPPQQAIDLGNGDRLFVWSKSRSFTTPGSATTTTTGNAYMQGNYLRGTATSETTYNPAQTSSYEATRSFWVNSSGTIYRWAWRGL